MQSRAMLKGAPPQRRSASQIAARGITSAVSGPRPPIKSRDSYTFQAPTTREAVGVRSKPVPVPGFLRNTILDPQYRQRNPVAIAEHFFTPYATDALPVYRQNLTTAICGNVKISCVVMDCSILIWKTTRANQVRSRLLWKSSKASVNRTTPPKRSSRVR